MYLSVFPMYLFADTSWRRLAFPLPIRVEKTQIKSDVYFAINCQKYNRPFNEIGPTSPELNFIKTQVEYILRDDYSNYSSSAFQTEAVDSQRTLFNEINSVYKDALPEIVGVQYRWGGIDYAVLDSSAKGPVSIPFITVRKHDTYKTGFGLALEPVIQNLAYIIESIQENPAEYSGQSDVNYEYSVQIPSPIVSPEGSDVSVELQFNGQIVDSKIFRKDDRWERSVNRAGRYRSLIDFYEESLLKLKKGETQAYLSTFAPESRERLQYSLPSMEIKQDKNVVEIIDGEIHHLKFILDAGEIKLLFYQKSEGGDLYYDTVRQTGSQFQRVNENYQAEFDALVRTDAFMNYMKTIAR